MPSFSRSYKLKFKIFKDRGTLGESRGQISGIGGGKDWRSEIGNQRSDIR
jgi:hypothetical protein